jgi:hypothetical protein
MAEQFTPTEEQIQAAIRAAGGDMRKLAVAYLRASRRARDAETAFNLMGDIQELTVAAATGDMSMAERAVKSAERHAAHHRDIQDSEGRGNG